METYSKITRFCLVCNYVTRIIDPLASRCSKFRFKSLDQSNAKRRLEEIAGLEDVKMGDGAVDTLIRCSEGDLRKAITYLQSAARLVGAVKMAVPKAGKRKRVVDEEDEGDAMDIDGVSEAVVTTRTIEEIAGVIPDNVISNLVQAMQPKKKGVVYEAVAKAVLDLIADGWSATQLVTQVFLQIPPQTLKRTIFDQKHSCIAKCSTTTPSPTSKKPRSQPSSPKSTNVS